MLFLLSLLFLLPPSSSSYTTCPPHNYTTHLLSTSPLIIYIPSFLTSSELTHLASLSSGSHFYSSAIADGTTGDQHVLSTIRTSRSTSLSRDGDEIVRCIEQRALDFQGLRNPARLEPLQLVHYNENEKYHAHTDWFTSASQTGREQGGNRLSSFFVYVDVSTDLMGGGTGFPFVEAPGSMEEGEGGEEEDEWWCKYLSCDSASEEGVVVRPIAGNAVFWRNLKEVRGRDGHMEYVGDQKTLHAGLPVQRGRKLGMNIWTREGELGEQYRNDKRV